jgi:hypothetical protein
VDEFGLLLAELLQETFRIIKDRRITAALDVIVFE